MTTETKKTIDTAALPIKIEFVAKTKRDDWECFEWRVKFTSKAGHWSTPYYCGMAHVTKPKHRWQTPQPKAPSVDDVLHSLILDADAEQENFHDWCANYGYSDDSISALNTYKACLLTATMLRKHLGRETVEALRIQLADR